MIVAVYSHPNNGYESDRKMCKDAGLVVGKEYEMSHISVGSSSSEVYLMEFPNKHFNSVHFDYYEYHQGMKYEVDVYGKFYRDDYI